jgi:hypothetical protein
MNIEEDKNDLSIDYLKNESIKSRFVKSLHWAKKTLFFHIDMKNIYLFIFEVISKRDQKFNEHIIVTMFFF